MQCLWINLNSSQLTIDHTMPSRPPPLARMSSAKRNIEMLHCSHLAVGQTELEQNWGVQPMAWTLPSSLSPAVLSPGHTAELHSNAFSRTAQHPMSYCTQALPYLPDLLICTEWNNDTVYATQRLPYMVCFRWLRKLFIGEVAKNMSSWGHKTRPTSHFFFCLVGFVGKYL